MLGAIIGDIVGSRREFLSTNDYNFELFSELNDFTDDSVCTFGVADAILHGKDYGQAIQEWCRRYPGRGYGYRFASWIEDDARRPYMSYGNGSAMRVSPVGWAFYGNEDLLLSAASASAECSHNHPEGIKGAQTVALAISLALKLREEFAGKEVPTSAIIENVISPCVSFSGYDVDFGWAEKVNIFDVTCQGTVPVALRVIAESSSFEDAIRHAIIVGADADTLGAIVGSIAEAIWPIPEEMSAKAIAYLTPEMRELLGEFRGFVGGRTPRMVPPCPGC